ncbi:cellulose 1,4-beta-cellobiosidase, partial [bacterium]|nr:cellulose 1,4-beta-cellobiosidase [bacterium]
AVTGADNYNIYRSVVPMGQPSGTFTNIGSSPSNAYEDSAVTTGMTHFYYVTALNGADESDPSNVVNVDVQ